MKKYIVFLLSVLFSLTISFEAHANEIDNINIHIDIKKDGSVEVTEERNQNMDDGTENYIVFNEEDMQGTKLTQFSVDGFKEVKEWDSDWKRDEKAGKYSILNTDDGFDLVWGIGEYGDKTYTVHYTLTNMVKNLKDGQSIYWDFNTFTELQTDEMTMTISSYEPFTKENVRFYGFGIVGNMHLKDGNIVWKSSEAMDDSNYATVLLQFDSKLFNTNVDKNKTLEEERNMALHNSNYNEDYLDSNETLGPKMSLTGKIFAGLGILLGSIVGLWTIAGLWIANRKKKAHGHIKSGYTIKKDIKNSSTKIPPSEMKDYAGYAYLLNHLDYAYFEQFISAYLIKWQRSNRIEIVFEDDSKKLNKRNTSIIVKDYETEKEEYGKYFEEALKQIKNETYNGDYELLLWMMFLNAMDDHKVITKKNLEKWFKKNATDVSKVADYLEDYSKEYLEENGYIKVEKDSAAFVPFEVIIPTTKGHDLIEHFVKYSNYLQNEDEDTWLERVKNDEIQTEELIYIYLLGVTDEIESRFKKYHLNKSEENYFYPNYFYLFNNTTNYINTGLSSGGFSSSQASSGLGGSTGMGGGAGAGGGGGGGAR